MLAVIPAAAALGFLQWLGHGPVPSAVLGAMIGGSLAGVVLVATKNDLRGVWKRWLWSFALVFAIVPIGSLLVVATIWVVVRVAQSIQSVMYPLRFLP